MSRSEELAMLLRIEYRSYNHCISWFRKGLYDRETAKEKINSRCRVINTLKQWCVQELPEEEYPEEYYLPDPLPADQIIGLEAEEPVEPETEKKDTHLTAVLPNPDNAVPVQLSLFDLYGEI